MVGITGPDGFRAHAWLHVDQPSRSRSARTRRAQRRRPVEQGLSGQLLGNVPHRAQRSRTEVAYKEIPANRGYLSRDPASSTGSELSVPAAQDARAGWALGVLGMEAILSPKTPGNGG